MIIENLDVLNKFKQMYAYNDIIYLSGVNVHFICYIKMLLRDFYPCQKQDSLTKDLCITRYVRGIIAFLFYLHIV